MLDLKNAENELLPYQDQQRDTISIGVSGSYLVLPAFRNFMAHHPEISLNVKEFSTEQTIKKLTDSAVDIGIVYRTALPAQLSSTMLFEDEIIAAIPLSHPLATRERLHLKDLNDQPIIVLNDSLLLRGSSPQNLITAKSFLTSSANWITTTHALSMPKRRLASHLLPAR